MTARSLESATTGGHALTIAHMRRAVTVSFAASFVAVVGWLIVRRLAGATSATGVVPLLAAAVVVNGTMVAIRWWPTREGRILKIGDWWLHGLLSVSAVVLGLVISHRDSAAAGLVAWWALLVGQECWWWTSILRRRPAEPRPPGRGAVEPSERFPELTEPNEPSEPDGVESESLLPAGVDQQVTRRRDVTGHESVEGVFRVRFDRGQRTTELHLAFCPPLESAPRVEPQHLAGPKIQITVGQAETYGARLELRRAPPSDEAGEVLLFVACHP